VAAEQSGVRVEATAGRQPDDDADGLAVVERRPLSPGLSGQTQDDKGRDQD
jgi:hypothetical protein